MGLFNDEILEKQEGKMKIGIYGGSFNPIHNGHLLLAERAAEEQQLDKVFFVPARHNPFKETTEYLPLEDRLQMVRLAITDNEKFQWCSQAMDTKGPSYFVDTVEFFKKQYPDAKLYYIVGDDTFCDIDQWKDIQHIVDSGCFLVGSRGSTSLIIPRILQLECNMYCSSKWLGVSMPRIDISSSLIRECCTEGYSIKYMVPNVVENYLKSCMLRSKYGSY
jgi:nicotinate-nucleotide adenylyltransferase